MRNVPKLRFKEFTDEWEEKRLGNYLIEFKEKIPYTTNLPKLTSSRKGLLFQKDYYDNREVKTETEYGLLPRGYFTYRHMSDDLIFKFNINDLVDNGAISKEYPVFTTKNFDSRFLYYLLNYGDDFKKFAIEQKQGGTRTRLYFKKLITFSPKAPILNEQNKIGKFIFNIDKRISITEEKLNLFNEYKKGIMHKLFNQELRFKDENGNDYPEWKEIRLENIVNINKGKQLNKEFLLEDDKYPVINGGILPSGYTNTYNSLANTITISEGGNSCGYVNFIKKDFWAGGHCYVLERKEDINYRYLYQVLKNNETKIMELRVGSGLPNIQKKSINEYKIQISESLEEQQKIADFLSAIDTKIEKISDELENLKEFKKGLLQQMFV